jgi:dimethylglycine dehydrogenase
MTREARMVRERGGLLDLGSFSKYEVAGQDATALLDRLTANRLPRKVGGIALAHMLTPAGGIRSEVTITRLAEDRFFLVTAAAAEVFDLDWIAQHGRAEEWVTINNVTDRWGCLVLAGPRARDVLARHCLHDLSNKGFPWRTMRAVTVAGVPVRTMRLNYVGELGWELFHPIEQQQELYHALSAAGATFGVGDFGFRAMDSLRLEKSYRGWGSDINCEVTPWEAGLDRFVHLDKGAFIGREALVRQRLTGMKKKIVTLDVDATDTDARGNEPVFKSDKVVGITTSGGYGAWIEKSLALAYVDADSAARGTALAIELMGERRPALVIADSPFDPENARLRA